MKKSNQINNMKTRVVKLSEWLENILCLFTKRSSFVAFIPVRNSQEFTRQPAYLILCSSYWLITAHLKLSTNLMYVK